jgi:hypothetical protein
MSDLTPEQIVAVCAAIKDAVRDALPELQRRMRVILDAAVAEEREACARLCDRIATEHRDLAAQYGEQRDLEGVERAELRAESAAGLAETIRARGEASAAERHDAFDPAGNPRDARLAEVAAHEPVLYATLTAWQQAELPRGEALTRAIELLAQKAAAQHAQLVRAAEIAPRAMVLVGKLETGAAERARLLALAPTCGAQGCDEPATTSACREPGCPRCLACDEHANSSDHELPHAALVRALRWLAGKDGGT